MLIEYHQGTFLLQISHKARHAHLGWDTHQHMNMVKHEMSLQNLNSFIFTERFQNFSHTFTELCKYDFPSRAVQLWDIKRPCYCSVMKMVSKEIRELAVKLMLEVPPPADCWDSWVPTQYHQQMDSWLSARRKSESVSLWTKKFNAFGRRTKTTYWTSGEKAGCNSGWDSYELWHAMLPEYCS